MAGGGGDEKGVVDQAVPEGRDIGYRAAEIEGIGNGAFR
jgi:hypothetical protein